MLTPNKIRALRIFAHSRLTGAFTAEPSPENIEVIQSNNELKKNDLFKEIALSVTQIVQALEKENLTINYLNNLPHNLITYQMVHYYKTAAKILNNAIPQDDYVIDGIIGISILTYIQNEKNVSDDPFDYNKIIENYELVGRKDKNYLTIIRKMQSIAFDITKAVEKDSYIKAKKANNKRKKTKRAS